MQMSCLERHVKDAHKKKKITFFLASAWQVVGKLVPMVCTESLLLVHIQAGHSHTFGLNSYVQEYRAQSKHKMHTDWFENSTWSSHFTKYRAPCPSLAISPEGGKAGSRNLTFQLLKMTL